MEKLEINHGAKTAVVMDDNVYKISIKVFETTPKYMEYLYCIFRMIDYPNSIYSSRYRRYNN